ncbi:M24 family metallopeptidase [Candidatus Laterigemmans baculatus]|uniref:M24 family metallopeptidase n=1 Tax=Candidatus Laterigemmans baculatus TaxID=2770505 RepID=UPI0013DB2ACF|nr:M24 family metallopeptidase [Candidatus Laterigemmans baculatus]
MTYDATNYEATLLGGIPAENPTLFRKVLMTAGDPAAWIETAQGESTLIIRDVEVDRARRTSSARRVTAPAEFAPAAGLDSDRATATAQAAAECLRRIGARRVRTDRSLPFIFAWHVQQAGMEIVYDDALGVLDRRVKSEQEIEWLAEAQATTERAMEMACSRIARAEAAADGTLREQGEPLTSERLKSEIAKFLLDLGYTMGHGCIVATLPDSGDCHASGRGPLRTAAPVIVDIFPRCEATRYHGDCTRTVVHGTPTETVARMHAAVVAAKAAGIAKLVPGETAAAVHRAVVETQQQHGFQLARGTVTDHPTIQHGTGHGIGLEVHEPILLDDGGGELLAGEVFTVEPGLYGRSTGGVRIEDMLLVTDAGPRNLNRLPEGLDWR